MHPHPQHRRNTPSPQRVVVWFSCGAASAVAAKMAVEKYPHAEVCYCDTLAYEHPDNKRFMSDVESWIGTQIKVLKSEKYDDIFDVFYKTKYLVGVRGARCTVELKKNVRKSYQQDGDLQVLGMTADEADRIARFEDANPHEEWEWILEDEGVTKSDCYRIIQEAGIKLPEMYLMGYNNNNCIGCVKGQSGYWNKIRRDFPAVFDRMAKTERDLGVAINKRYENGTRIRVFLDELDPSAGRGVPMPDIECGAFCVAPPDKDPGLFDGIETPERSGTTDEH